MKTVGFPISEKENEKRRCLIPSDIINIKNKEFIFIEKGYGNVLGYSEEDYLKAGVKVASKDEILSKDIICDAKIGDAKYLKDLHNQIAFGWVHAVQNRDITDILIDNKLTVYAWEDMYDGGRHVFWRNNEIAGEAAIMHAYTLHGIFPYDTKVAILGKGNTARGALKILTFMGADVTIYDRKTEKLFQKELGDYDVIVNCVLWDTSRKDHIIYRNDLKRLKKGCLLIDVSCDRNGGIETSVPTTMNSPLYEIDGIVHYAVDHTPSIFYKTISKSLSNVVSNNIDYLIEDKWNDILRKALIIEKGKVLDQRINHFQGGNMKAKYNIIPEYIKVILRKTSFYKKHSLKRKTVVKYYEVDSFLNEAPVLNLGLELKEKPNVGIIKTQESVLGKDYVNPKASWLRYERFCKNNDIPYGFFDITRSNWMSEAKKYDIFICHTESNPAYQEMIESKIYILEKIMGKFCFPSYHELWQYENKNRANYLYDYFRLPKIPTYVTQNREEAFELIEEVGYPFITKTTIGAASTGVRKIKTRSEAVKMINSIFCHNGLKTQYPYQRQKDYFYIQKFINDARFDLRIMLVGDMAFGYYRYPNQGDFRASGAGNYEKKAIPDDALRLAIDVRNKLNSRLMGIDLLYSETNKKYYIIETSLFNQIDTPEQLVIDGVPGYYDISDIDNIRFKEGKFWIQELILRDVILEWYDKSMTV